MKPKFSLRTPHGDSYTIMDGGEIQRDDGHNTASASWRLVGLQHVRRREFIPFSQLGNRLHEIGRYKNGKPQWTVRDFDHGTIREWGNTEHHGVAWLVPA